MTCVIDLHVGGRRGLLPLYSPAPFQGDFELWYLLRITCVMYSSMPCTYRRRNAVLHITCQGPKMRFAGRQCDQKFCTGDQNFTTGRQSGNYAISRHDIYTINSFDFQPN